MKPFKPFKLFILIVVSFMAIIMSSCDENKTMRNTADATMNAKQEQLMNEASKEVGMPAIVNFQERKLAKQIFELRDKEDLICYAYIMNQMSGKMIFLGKCLGYGLPYSIQFTNPEKVLVEPNSVEAGDVPYTIPQADPNGLFMPEGLAATWIMLLDAKGVPHPVYVENDVIVSPFPLTPAEI